MASVWCASAVTKRQTRRWNMHWDSLENTRICTGTLRAKLALETKASVVWNVQTLPKPNGQDCWLPCARGKNRAEEFHMTRTHGCTGNSKHALSLQCKKPDFLFWVAKKGEETRLKKENVVFKTLKNHESALDYDHGGEFTWFIARVRVFIRKYRRAGRRAWFHILAGTG